MVSEHKYSPAYLAAVDRGRPCLYPASTIPALAAWTERAVLMTLLDDVAHLDATAQAALVRQREVQPSELVEAAIERIEHG